MALSANKRRKVEHSSPGEDDAASFASFGEEDGQDGVPGEGTELDGRDSAHDGNALDEDESDDEDEAGEVEAEEAPSLPSVAAKMLRKTQSRDARAKAAKTALDSGGGLYTAGTFKSNLFKLQVDELLEQIRPRRGKREEAAEQALHALKRTIDKAPARGSFSVDEAERQLLMSSKVAVPFPSPKPPKDAKYKLQYAKPANSNVVGSFALKTATREKGSLAVDMTVTMPSSLFQDKDYLNHRYFYKRAYYLACIAAALKAAHSSEYDLRFEDLHGDQLKPVLVVTPAQPAGHEVEAKPTPKWMVKIIPCVSADLFPQDKLLPDRNCIRPSAEAKAEPTPLYNSSLRADMLMPSYLKLIHNAASTSSAFCDACLLGSTWLRQRGLGSNIAVGGFGNFEWSALIALLLQGGGPGGKPLLSEGYSSYQLFKATLQILAMRNMSKQGLMVGHADGDTKLVPNGAPVVWDGPRGHNVLYKVTPWTYIQLRQEAKTTITTLGDQLFDGFEATFITRVDSPLLRYDHVLELPASVVKSANVVLFDVLKRGLGDRVIQVAILPPLTQSWLPGSARPTIMCQAAIKVGFVVNPDNVNRTVDHGPGAESKVEAASFRKFWGEKAELRRFKDGSILESLIWSPSDSGKTVLEQIVRYLLGRHFGEDAEQGAELIGDGFSRMISQGSTMAAFQPQMEAYKQLETDVRGLEGLPLSVRQLLPADAQLRYASSQPPLGGKGRQRPMPADVTIQFEGSARWPDDLVAIQRTKIAFLLKLSEQLQEATDSVTARIGLENQNRDILNQAYLEISYESGAAFRMRIHHDREQTLLERQLKDKLVGPSAKEAAAVGLAAYKRDYIKAPAHTHAIARLCSRHPALSGTIRLTKKWFASHLLANHVADEVVELIAARTFVQPWPWQAPSSVQAGFLRTLHWLSRWDWRAEPLIVDLSGSGELKQPDVQAIQTSFEAWRKLDPSMNRTVLFAASNVDPEGTTWTDGRPAKVIAGRMTALAKAACAEVEGKQLGLEAAGLFASPLNDYDFILHIDPTLSGGRKRKNAANGTTFKNLELAILDDSSLVGFDPISSFLTELEELFGSAILLFSGGLERPVITGLWSPQTAVRSWKVNLAYSTIPTKAPKAEDVQAEINKEAILSEIARLGGNMVERIEVNR
ncbi:hypothetical protein LTR36_007700 [Oleoguttula mirabilis]|uniref:U3 small nucleolar RNA-associated protein 22 n=1 Tax=Oleoguttula mirabilis TaxID=1507867 RepID=A0AAV9JVY1_9PEZI|nr:hypothetical protein LTR36_007700 [Oleoguttula mirabilis]